MPGSSVCGKPSPLAVGCRDTTLEARALAALGGALVHADPWARRGRARSSCTRRSRSRNRPESALRPFSPSANSASSRSRPAAAGPPMHWLTRAQQLAESDGERAAILGVRGMNSSDRGDYPAAFEQLRESVEIAAGCADLRQQAWSLSLVGPRAPPAGRVQPRRRAAIRDCSTWSAANAGSPSCLGRKRSPPSSTCTPATSPTRARRFRGGLGSRLPAERPVLGRHGRPRTRAARRRPRRSRSRGGLAGTRSLACRARTRPLPMGARPRAGRSHHRGPRPRRHRPARPLAVALSSLAARCDLRELLVRAYCHLADLGDPQAAARARTLASDIDNPHLHSLLPSRRSPSIRAADSRSVVGGVGAGVRRLGRVR